MPHDLINQSVSALSLRYAYHSILPLYYVYDSIFSSFTTISPPVYHLHCPLHKTSSLLKKNQSLNNLNLPMTASSQKSRFQPLKAHSKVSARKGKRNSPEKSSISSSSLYFPSTLKKKPFFFFNIISTQFINHHQTILQPSSSTQSTPKRFIATFKKTP